TAAVTVLVVAAAVASEGLAARRAIAADVDIVLPTDAADDTTPDDPAGGPTTTAEVPIEPLRSALILGDSIVHDAYPTTAALFAEAGVEPVAIGGPAQSWLTHDWVGELEQALAEHDPDVVVLGGCCGIGLNQG